jgi:hypothetical protein
MTSLAEIERAEFQCLDALSKLRAVKANVLRAGDTLRKSAGRPATVTPGSNVPQPLVTISGQGGGRQSQAEENWGIEVIKALRQPRRILPRPPVR